MVERYASRSEAMERAAFLQANGIATHVSDMTAMRLNLAHQGRFRAGLWVVFEDQYQDAAALLANPDHRVEKALSPEEMQHIQSGGEAEVRTILLKWSVITLVGLAAIAALVVAGPF
ncbi:MAG: hypothetical protein ACXIUB_03475 [Wenzhouxiangella sp.]